jgi:crotonobetainyl-CoA:carnitine CoA-transferase CaiB-like acyl-CoA transferase
VDTDHHCSPDHAAAVELTTASGLEREAVVEWAGPISGVVDEATAQAVSGVMHVHGRRTGEPRGLGLDYCATAAAVLASTGLLASLLNDQTHKAHVRTSVAEAGLLAVSQYLAASGGDDPEAVSLAPGGPPFTSSDGVVFEVETLQPEPWATFWKKLGADEATAGKSWRAFQFRYATATAPLGRDLHDLAGQHTFADLLSIAAAAEVSVCRLHTTTEAAAAVGIEPGAPWPAPWQLHAGEPADCATSSRSEGQRPLAGFAVLEAGRRVQAPLAAHLMSLLGARTTRIEPPGGDPMRGMPPTCEELSARWLALNRYKEAVELDIKSTTDRQRLRNLTEDADVFVHNWAPGKAEQLGLAAADLPAHLVYAYTSAVGSRQLPDTPIGTDFMLQARTGMAELVRPQGESPAPSLMTLLDVLGGLLGAEAIVAGLVQRSQYGHGVDVESSLLGASAALQIPLLSQGVSRRPVGFRVPEKTSTGWRATPDVGGEPVEVTTELLALLDDPRFDDVLARDERNCPALRSPWRLS